MNFFQTVHTCCGHTEDVHVGFLMELEIIWTELWPSELSHFGQLFWALGYGVV